MIFYERKKEFKFSGSKWNSQNFNKIKKVYLIQMNGIKWNSWQEFLIGIHSNPFRFIPKSVSELI